MMNGEVVPHELETTDTIVEVKKRVGDKQGMDVTVIKLNFGEEEQPDDTGLDTLKVKVGSNEVPLVCQERVNVTAHLTTGQNDQFDMLTTNTILDVKKRISEKEGIEQQLLKLMFNRQEVHDPDTLESIKLQAGSNDIRLVAEERDSITVQMTNGHSVPLEMDPQNTVLDVKKQIKDHEGIEPDLQKLLFRDEEVFDDQTLESI